MTAIAFALCHFRPSWFDVLYLTCNGIGFALLRARSGSVLPSMVVHGLVNAMPRSFVSADFWGSLWAAELRPAHGARIASMLCSIWARASLSAGTSVSIRVARWTAERK